MTDISNILPHNYVVNREHRQALNRHKAQVVWFTGLSGSGKSTLANALEVELAQQGIHTYILDGDGLRTGLCADLGFSIDDRRENIRRAGEVAKLMHDAGLVVITAFVSPFRADREWVKRMVSASSFIEVFVDCPLEVCERRDVKGLYKKARAGEIKNFTGISSVFEEPLSADIVLKTNELTIEHGVNMVKDLVQSRISLEE